MRPEQMGELSLLVVGSPTRAFRPSPAVSAFLRVLPKGSLRGVKAAAFDTRIATSDIKSAPLRFIMNLFGYAAKPIASKLAKKGAELIALPEGFLVGDKEGPLKDGELDRATAWAKQIAVKMTDR
jgi:flavodoxin